MQRLLLNQLNVNVRYNNNAPVHLNDCIEGLLHLGLNVTSRTVITFRPSTVLRQA